MRSRVLQADSCGTDDVDPNILADRSKIGTSDLKDGDLRPMRQIAILGTLQAIKGYTFRRSNHMNNQSRTLRRIGEGILALVATGVSLLILQFALAA